jgi:hypothetical protein
MPGLSYSPRTIRRRSLDAVRRCKAWSTASREPRSRKSTGVQTPTEGWAVIRLSIAVRRSSPRPRMGTNLSEQCSMFLTNVQFFPCLSDAWYILLTILTPTSGHREETGSTQRTNLQLGHRRLYHHRYHLLRPIFTHATSAAIRDRRVCFQILRRVEVRC